MKLSLLIAGVVAGALTMMAPGLAAAQSITIATEGAYEPWNFTAPDGSLQGFEVDLANDLCARAKMTCTIVAQDWDGLIPALNAKKFDAIMASLIVTKKRLEVIDFSAPYAPTLAGFMVDKSGPLAALAGTGGTLDLDADAATVAAAIDAMKPLLQGKVIGVQSSTANAAMLDKYFKGVVEVREYKTVEQHDLDLQAGRIDGVVAQLSSINSTLGKPGFENYAAAGPGMKGDIFGQGIGVGLRKGETELKAAFDAAIAAAEADGTITRLSQKWFKTDTP